MMTMKTMVITMMMIKMMIILIVMMMMIVELMIDDDVRANENKGHFYLDSRTGYLKYIGILSHDEMEQK